MSLGTMRRGSLVQAFPRSSFSLLASSGDSVPLRICRPRIPERKAERSRGRSNCIARPERRLTAMELDPDM